jgi:hypothetical protein
MAKLGRKALNSMQKPVGVKRGEIDSLASAMESEVTVCKYGPFEGKTEGQGPVERSQQPYSDTDVNGNALRLLSDAAARHSTNTPQSSSNYTSTPSRSTTACANSAPSNGIDGTGSYQQTPLTDALPTPNNSGNAETGFLPVATSTHYNDLSKFPSLTDSDFSAVAFSELDNMFDGFYDLSIPTVTFGTGQNGEQMLFDGFGNWNGVMGADGSGGFDMWMGGNDGMNFGSNAALLQHQRHQLSGGSVSGTSGVAASNGGGGGMSEYPDIG